MVRPPAGTHTAFTRTRQSAYYRINPRTANDIKPLPFREGLVSLSSKFTTTIDYLTEWFWDAEER